MAFINIQAVGEMIRNQRKCILVLALHIELCLDFEQVTDYSRLTGEGRKECMESGCAVLVTVLGTEESSNLSVWVQWGTELTQ